MKRTLRRGLPVAAVSVLIVAGVLLATRPWSGEEAAGETIEWRLCDTVLEAPLANPGPEWVAVGRLPALGDEKPTINLKLYSPSGRSEVPIDANTGAMLWQQYADPSHQATLQGLLQTVRVEPLDPATAPWPYTDKIQVSLERQGSGGFEYRPVDPGSGILVSVTRGLGDGFHVHVLKAENCRSTIEISTVFRTAEPEEVTVTKDVHPDDEAAFQTFYDEVVIKGLDR